MLASAIYETNVLTQHALKQTPTDLTEFLAYRKFQTKQQFSYFPPEMS
jgi:hypothetical protein